MLILNNKVNSAFVIMQCASKRARKLRTRCLCTEELIDYIGVARGGAVGAVGAAPPSPQDFEEKKLRGLKRHERERVMMRTGQFKVNRQTIKIFFCKMCFI